MNTLTESLTDEIRIYKLANGWKAVMFVLVPALFLVGLGVTYFTITNEKPLDGGSTFLIIAMLGLAGFAVYAFIDLLKGKTITGEGKIIQVDPTKVKELYYEDVKGFRHDDKYIYIFSKNKKRSFIKVSRYIAGDQELLNWLDKRFINMDTDEYEAEQQEILNNEEFGLTEEVREARLSSAKKATWAFNIAGYIIAALVYFYGRDWVITLGIAYPLIAVLYVQQTNGLVKLVEKKNSAYPSVMSGFLFVIMALGLFLLNNVSILQLKPLFQLSLIVFLFFGAAIYLINKDLRVTSLEKFGQLIFFYVIFFLYCLSSCTAINCVYDNSVPQYFHPKILNKRISNGKHTSYYVELEPWGPQHLVKEEDVGRTRFNELKVGETATVQMQSGRLGFPWYTVY